MSNIFNIGNSFVEVVSDDPSFTQMVKDAVSYYNQEVYWEYRRLTGMLRAATRQGNRRLIYAIKAKLATLGDPHVCLFQDNRFPTGLLDSVKHTLKTRLNAPGSIFYEEYDKRVRPEPYLILRANLSENPRVYQQEAINESIRVGRGVIEAACGSGKTLIAAHIIHQLAVKTLYIVPTSALLEQTGNVLISVFGKSKVTKISSTAIKRQQNLAPIRISTIQTLASLQKQGLIMEVLRDIDCVMIDEFQFAGAKSYTDLLPVIDHVYFRFGFTGSFHRQTKLMDMYGVLSNVIYSYPPKQATNEGYLTPIQYNVITLRGKFHKNYTVEYRRNYEMNPVLIRAIYDIVKYIPEEESILILVERKDKMGAIIYEYFKATGIDATWVSGDNSKEEINKAIEDFNDGKIKILIASTVCGVGVDIRAAHHLIWARGGKSEVAFVQGVGRASRLYPGKTLAHVYDFYFSGTRYLGQHLEERLNVFKDYFDGVVKGH